MEKDWVKIFESNSLQEVEITKGMLAENNIAAVILNKKDSTYGSFGIIELYVRRENVLSSYNLISK